MSRPRIARNALTGTLQTEYLPKTRRVGLGSPIDIGGASPTLRRYACLSRGSGNPDTFDMMDSYANKMKKNEGEELDDSECLKALREAKKSWS